jgi:predicted GNAT superfamily acetyltransferase
VGIVGIRDATRDDYEVILALNLADVAHTSPMDSARLSALDGLSCYHRVACIDGQVAGFLLAMRSGTPYENDNFGWFTRKYASFVYVDRVVVSIAARGRRLGSLLYEDLFSWARQNGIPLVTCEYNVVPPNEPSRLFHEKFGFREQGTQWLANRTKQVSLQTAETRLACRSGV